MKALVGRDRRDKGSPRVAPIILINVMRTSLLFFSVFALLFRACLASGQTKYDTYSNARFKYSIEYPVSRLAPQDEAQNGDGRLFEDKKGIAELRVWGQYNALFDTLKTAYAHDLKERGTGVTYKLLRDNSYVISGKSGDKVYYQKTILSGNDGDADAVFATFTLEYSSTEKNIFDAIATHVSKSFRFD
jgi:hypothetical protein